MGIGDLFGKGKKKAEFREKAKEALAKGKLVPGKADELQKLQDAHEVDDIADDKTMLRRDIYNAAAKGAKARGALTNTEAAELAKIQKFLNLRDDQVDRTQRDLARLRVLTDIRRGRLPVVPTTSVALRGVKLEAGEVPHYATQVDVFDRPSTGGHDGVALKWGVPYKTFAARAHTLPVEGAKEIGGGYLFLTNQRLYFKGERQSAAVQYSPQADIFLYAEGIRLQRTVGHTLLRFKSGAGETAEIIGELLSALLR